MPEKTKKKLLFFFGSEAQDNMVAIPKCLEKFFKVIKADNVLKAVELLRSKKFDLIMMEAIYIPCGQENAANYELKTSQPALDVLLSLRQGEFANAGNGSDLPVYILTCMSQLEIKNEVEQHRPDVIHQMPEKVSTIIATCQELARA